jgi:hypothetical protein
MMIYREKIAPPLAIPLTDDEQMKVIAEAVGSEDRWVNSWRCSGHKALKQRPPQLAASFVMAHRSLLDPQGATEATKWGFTRSSLRMNAHHRGKNRLSGLISVSLKFVGQMRSSD